MSQVPSLSEGQVDALARVLGECGTGTEISHALDACGLVDASGESTKWRRLYKVFMRIQNQDHSANRVLAFCEAFLHPARFLGQSADYREVRVKVNGILSFSGFELGDDGKFHPGRAARTLSEAERRVAAIKGKLAGRAIHPEVTKYCRTELMQDNYFHAVFEASKGLAQRIREMSSADGDGAALVDRVFAVDNPILALNTLQTETERTDHKGFSMLLKGCFVAVRNPLAHEPKILWEGEEDAADWLTLISLLHRRLDECFPTQLRGSTHVR